MGGQQTSDSKHMVPEPVPARACEKPATTIRSRGIPAATSCCIRLLTYSTAACVPALSCILGSAPSNAAN